MMKYQSPYNAAITGGGFLFEETNALLPLLQSPDRAALLKDEVLNNRLLHIHTERSRKRVLAEIARRYDTMSRTFWEEYEAMSEGDRRVALLFVILKTYKLLFDFHVHVTMKRWNSASKRVEKADIRIEFNEISARDEYVDSWSEITKDRVAATYLSILRNAGLLNRAGQLCALRADNFAYYLTVGEPWFLEACLLHPYQIDNIKQTLL